MTTRSQKFPARSLFAEKRDSRPLRRDGPTAFPHTPKLMDQLHEALRSRHYGRRTEQDYCRWARRFIFFHNVRHPAEMAGERNDGR